MDYCTVSQLTLTATQINAQIKIHPKHDIFKGHFPDMPILPGACQVQMITKILEQAIGCTFRLQKADHIKFLAMVNPDVDSDISLEIKIKSQEENDISITATMINAGNVIIKFSGKYEKSV